MRVKHDGNDGGPKDWVEKWCKQVEHGDGQNRDHAKEESRAHFVKAHNFSFSHKITFFEVGKYV